MDNFNFAELLRQYREQGGHSVRDMAEILCMSKSAYDRLEKGLTKPTYEQIQRIFKLLHIEPDTFREIDTKGRPVGTITYLKRGLLYGSISTDIALSCLADLAEAIGDVYMLEWAKVESQGYYDRSKKHLPLYRWHSSIFEMECIQDGKKFFLTLPSGVVYGGEELSSPGFNSGIDRVNEQWPPPPRKLYGIHDNTISDLGSRLKKIYGPRIKLIRAAEIVPSGSIQKVLLAVQEIILRFLLEVETEIGSNADLNDLREQKYLVGKLFRNVQDTVGSAEYLELPIKPATPKKITLVKGDEDTFCDWLDEHNISTYELDEFFVLLDMLDETPQPAGIVPLEMCAWAKKVTSSNPRFREDDKKLLNGLKVFFGVAE